MQTPEQFEHELKQQYQHDKALHPLPEKVRRVILQRAALYRRPRWQFSWRSMQLALSCALLLVLGYLLQLPQPQPAPLYYQLVVTHSDDFREVQQHSVSALMPADPISKQYQQYVANTARSEAFHRQTGLLQQHQQQWQITVCNDLLLTIDGPLLARLDMPQLVRTKPEQPQWVEFISNRQGQLVAIQPAAQALVCPHS